MQMVRSNCLKAFGLTFAEITLDDPYGQYIGPTRRDKAEIRETNKRHVKGYGMRVNDDSQIVRQIPSDSGVSSFWHWPG